MKYTVDTNIFLRYLTGDDKKKVRRIKKFFERVKENGELLTVEPYVIVELAHMLSNYYKLPKNEVCAKLRSIFAQPIFEINERENLQLALEIFAIRGIDFVDALLFIYATRHNTHLLSFDSHFDKLTPKLRVEP